MIGLLFASTALTPTMPTLPTPGTVWVRAHQQQQTPVVVRQWVAPSESAVFPTTTLTAGILDLGKDGYVKASPNAIPGAAKDIDLGSLLDTVPSDPQGERGLKKDAAGVERLKDRP